MPRLCPSTGAGHGELVKHVTKVHVLIRGDLLNDPDKLRAKSEAVNPSVFIR